MPSYRAASFAVFVLGIAASFSWAWWQISLFERSHPGFGCGLPIVGIYVMATIALGITSLLATLLNAFSFVRLAKPRPALRILELAALATPAILAAVLVGELFYDLVR